MIALESELEGVLQGIWRGIGCSAAVAGLSAAGQGKARGAGFGGFGGGDGTGGGGAPPSPPFPPFAGFPWSLLRRHRAKRGDVRAAILALVGEKPLNGYQIMQELEQRSRGSWRPSPGAVYPALQLLEDEGLVRAENSNGGRVYSLTEAGRGHVQEHADEFAAPWESAQQNVADEPILGLFGELKHLAAASLQIVHAGSANQIREGRRILNQARRGLYHLLADDGKDDTDD